MADQKNDDSKTPFARRGARPFGGPANTSAPNRPFVRPATPHRPTAAPFVAPVGPGKLVLRKAESTPVAKVPTPVAPPSIPSPEFEATPLSSGPTTSELGVLDETGSRDAVWSVAERPERRPVEPAAVASPLDELSLGSGIDDQQLWAEDITANDIRVEARQPVPPPAAFESNDAAAVGTTPAWLEDDVALPAVATPSLVDSGIVPPATEARSVPTAVPPASDASDDAYGFGEWTDAHMIPTSDEIMSVLPQEPVAPVLEPLGDGTPAPANWNGEQGPDASERYAGFELAAPNEEPQPDVDQEEPQAAVVTGGPTALAYAPHEARIAATFDRLADRVRSGEIDVSSIAPEAPDAAVLASVLVALLGGSRSR